MSLAPLGQIATASSHDRLGFRGLTDGLAKTTRREMIGRTTRFAATLALGSAVAPLLAAPGSRGFKIGAPEWSLGKTDPSCFEVAREIGLDGVQVNLGSLGDQMHLR